VKQFTAIVKQQNEDASRYVHWGATSQDIIDTAMILQCRDALVLIEKQLQSAYQISLKQAEHYRDQVMIGRTWLQQALPITLGHKFARYAAALKRDLDRLQAMKSVC
jgi:3-carboxy-cis,cis-muconate cycloisomerase